MIYKLPEGWKEVKLGDVTRKIGSGSTPRGGSKVYVDKGISFIRSQNVMDFTFSKNGLVNIDKIAAKKLNNVEILPNDILINITGDSVTRTCLVPADILPARVNQHVSIVRENEDIAHYKYLVYKLQSLKKVLLSYASSGATRKALTKNMLENLKINIPPLLEQKKIGNTLSALDDKISINNKINKNLEKQVQAIFKKWFVDFEFPDENGNSYKTSGGKMIESELGMIPKGWGIEVLKDVCNEITRGFNSKYVEKSNIKNLNQKVNRGEHLEKKHFKYLSEDIEIPDNRYVKKYDILLNSLGQGTLGRTHFYLEDEENIVADQHITLIRPNHEFAKNSYIYQALVSDEYKNLFENLVSGSTGMTMLNISKVREIKIVIPPNELQNTYDELVKTLYKEKEILITQNEKLSNLRDTLLPKLMSGEVRIPLELEV